MATEQEHPQEQHTVYPDKNEKDGRCRPAHDGEYEFPDEGWTLKWYAHTEYGWHIFCDNFTGNCLRCNAKNACGHPEFIEQMYKGKWHERCTVCMEFFRLSQKNKKQ